MRGEKQVRAIRALRPVIAMRASVVEVGGSRLERHISGKSFLFPGTGAKCIPRGQTIAYPCLLRGGSCLLHRGTQGHSRCLHKATGTCPAGPPETITQNSRFGVGETGSRTHGPQTVGNATLISFHYFCSQISAIDTVAPGGSRYLEKIKELPQSWPALTA